MKDNFSDWLIANEGTRLAGGDRILDICLPGYCSLPLSVLESAVLEVDGRPLALDGDTLVLGDQRYSLDPLPAPKSPLLGFIPDFGCSARALPASCIANLRDQGMPEDLLQLALEIWHLPQDAGWKRGEFARRVAPLNADPVVVSALSVMFNILSPGEPDMWDAILPQVIHIHGKFYDFDDAGNETAIPYAELLPRFQRAGYSGFMSSEWESHLYSRADAFEMVRKHQALARRILAGVPVGAASASA